VGNIVCEREKKRGKERAKTRDRVGGRRKLWMWRGKETKRKRKSERKGGRAGGWKRNNVRVCVCEQVCECMSVCVRESDREEGVGEKRLMG